MNLKSGSTSNQFYKPQVIQPVMYYTLCVVYNTSECLKHKCLDDCIQHENWFTTCCISLSFLRVPTGTVTSTGWLRFQTRQVVHNSSIVTPLLQTRSQCVHCEVFGGSGERKGNDLSIFLYRIKVQITKVVQGRVTI